MLTAVLLQANNRLSSEQGSYVLPSYFEVVATGVLKVLNNLALLDISSPENASKFVAYYISYYRVDFRIFSVRNMDIWINKRLICHGLCTG
ncbi:hypothetical protein AQUCO_02600139v1 [Aquilegia coerulea]|uniref:Uncharacterized protein n=1 Tax=Aquilegia coerulea TaxID=218851 RepID=A0A2G5D7J2_AQUCA|nr:hypothetical protein AQUCO_02600139v1 [Aquilegia coerulea]